MAKDWATNLDVRHRNDEDFARSYWLSQTFAKIRTQEGLSGSLWDQPDCAIVHCYKMDTERTLEYRWINYPGFVKTHMTIMRFLEDDATYDTEETLQMIARNMGPT